LSALSLPALTSPPPPPLSPLSLHDALPISPHPAGSSPTHPRSANNPWPRPADAMPVHSKPYPRATQTFPNSSNTAATPHTHPPRSEEHTSELQSLRHLVCRLLLEKKKTIHN